MVINRRTMLTNILLRLFFYANELQDKLTRGFLLPHYIVLIFCYWSNSTKPFVFFRNTFLKRLLLLHRILGKWKCNIIFSRSVATSPIRAHTRFHLRQTTALCFDDGNENAGKATLPHYTFLYIFLPSMHDFEVKLPNFTFYGERQTDDVELSLLFNSELGYALRSSTTGEFVWQTKGVAIIKLKRGITRSHFY